MPHTKSAKKSLRKNAKRRDHNRDMMKQIKVQIKALLRLSKDQASTPDALQQQYKTTVKRIDKAAARRVIHPNQAARKKSQLARLLNAKANPAAPAK